MAVPPSLAAQHAKRDALRLLGAQRQALASALIAVQVSVDLEIVQLYFFCQLPFIPC